MIIFVFNTGDYWAALGHYEEAADLGVWAAQENAAYLIERMLPTECAQYEDYVLMSGPGTGTGDSHAHNSNDRGDVSSRGDASSGAAAVTVSANSATSGSDGRGGGGGARYKCRTAEECCKQYLSKLATRRWAQLAQAGEPRAMRKVADALLDPTQPYMLSDHRAVSTSSLVAPTSSGAVAASADDNNGSTPVLSTQQQAALLYALAGEQGDSESLLHLGWMLYYGEGACAVFLLSLFFIIFIFILFIVHTFFEPITGVQRNQTTANALFNAAMKIEAGEELLGEEAALAAEDAAYDDSFGGPFGGDGGGVGNDDAAGLDGYTAAGATAEEDAAALQEASLSRHEHARRWHIAGYASKTTGGAAPALALAVVRADAMLRDFGFNTTVQELHVQAEVFLNAYMPDTLKDWWTADHRKQKKQQRTGVWGLLSNISRRLRATHRWIRQVEEQDSELYNALWETALLVAIIIVSNLLFRAFRH